MNQTHNGYPCRRWLKLLLTTTSIAFFSESPAQTLTWTNITCGTQFSLAIKSDHTLWSWGYDGYGQLGNGTDNSTIFVTQMGIQNDWAAVSAGARHVIALKTDGTLWTWGANENGQLGNGNTTSSEIPVQIGTDTNWSVITTGEAHSLAIKTDGTLWGWGANASGQLGLGTTNDQLVPVQIGSATHWIKIAAGGEHSLGLGSDGSLWAWGSNAEGQLGTGSGSQADQPVQIGTNDDWIEIDAGFEYSAGIRSDNTLWTWGADDKGQLGNGNILGQQSTPIQIAPSIAWKKVTTGSTHTFAISTEGFLYAWGRNSNGQLGIGSFEMQQLPVPVVNSGNEWYAVAAAEGTRTAPSIVIGFHSLGLKGAMNVICATGANNIGQLGTSNTTSDRDFNCNTGVLNVGIEETDLPGMFSVYPNPSDGIVTVDLTEAGMQDYFCTVTDLRGEIQLTQVISGEQLSLDFSDYPGGIYFITIGNKDHWETHRAVVH